jgi:hypothetical protein
VVGNRIRSTIAECVFDFPFGLGRLAGGGLPGRWSKVRARLVVICTLGSRRRQCSIHVNCDARVFEPKNEIRQLLRGAVLDRDDLLQGLDVNLPPRLADSSQTVEGFGGYHG